VQSDTGLDVPDPVQSDTGLDVPDPMQSDTGLDEWTGQSGVATHVLVVTSQDSSRPVNMTPAIGTIKNHSI
jgi:hypothetical protein